jgi:uncharacterized membrane protein YgdD (TMEM256/DUF423 family)
MHKNRTYIKLAGILGALAVMLGAFGSHVLKEYLTPEQMSAFNTAVSYQFYHVLALLCVGVLYKRYHTKLLARAGEMFLAGMLLFCGSLYLSVGLTVTGMGSLGALGLITPIGGVLLVVGWICLFIGVPNHVSKSESERE